MAPTELAILSAALIAHPAAAAQDCSIGREGWDDIQRFRRCLEEYHRDRWGDPWLLHRTSRLTTNPTIVRLLLQAGADPSAPDDDGLTPLHVGARNSNPTVVSHLLDASQATESVVSALLAAGADPNAKDVVDILLEAGADPMARDQDGDTPLHIAAGWTDDVAIIDALLDAGADLTAENEDGNRPVDLAWDIVGIEAYWRLTVPEGTLVPGRTFTGSLSSSDAAWGDGSHYDIWRVTARAVGQRVVIDMESDDVDAYLRVLRNDGTEIATDDDGGSGSNARVEFRAVHAWDYLVVATSFEGGGGGEYQVAVG